MKRSLLKLLFAVVTLGVLVSCSKVEGDAYMGFTYIFKNNSTHTIHVKDLNNETISFEMSGYDNANGIMLQPGEERVAYSTIASVLSPITDNVIENAKNDYWKYLADTAVVIFDDSYLVEHDRRDNEGEHEITDSENYTLERHERPGWNCTYTFTDADYEYAVEHGQRVTDAE